MKKRSLENILGFQLDIEFPQVKIDLDTRKLNLLIQLIMGMVSCFTRPDLPQPEKQGISLEEVLHPAFLLNIIIHDITLQCMETASGNNIK
jgi:hypothetical protein